MAGKVKNLFTKAFMNVLYKELYTKLVTGIVKNINIYKYT